ncbi:hypothetical protein ASD55_07820 [Rhodanobacter sp. Root561]|uniref:hypothetical protein n=1 Tax=Rhodanobacter sp. Root561 TaxID=1736560 RepID=UPI0006F720CE|nr:hypothetical protein [Rhodanobacter sp. Root561]KQZ77756.1 hypothetical protein ASD55_07820 [Rhodanobacter sp. Root561]
MSAQIIQFPGAVTCAAVASKESHEDVRDQPDELAERFNNFLVKRGLARKPDPWGQMFNDLLVAMEIIPSEPKG